MTRRPSAISAGEAPGPDVRNKPLAIAPSHSSHGPIDIPKQPPMPHTCQTCARRKVRCDKIAPTCSTCRKSRLDCVYQTPQPRLRKRKLSDKLFERLDRYENILRQHGLLPDEPDTQPAMSVTDTTPSEEAAAGSTQSVSFRWNEPDASRTGKLHSEQGRSHYVDSVFWSNVTKDGEVEPASGDDNEYDDQGRAIAGGEPLDPLTGAFLGAAKQDLLYYHPSHAEAMLLWKTHVENVEPICKILHIPTTTKIVEQLSQHPETASRDEECLLFAIYHSAMHSISDEDYTNLLLPHNPNSRPALLQRYHNATTHALINASFLRTTSLPVLQSLALYLLSSRATHDPHTFWILTGTALRLGQRMGLHRDGELLGLDPFATHLRRRLFYQLLPLDGGASQASGISVPMVPEGWDARQPLSVDDADVWPGMREADVAVSREGSATEMMLCNARSTLGRLAASSRRYRDGAEAGRAIDAAERELQDRYIRYCDVVDPLHFLTVAMCRTGVASLRMRLRLPAVKDGSATAGERRGVFGLARGILEADGAICAHAGVRRRFGWHVGGFSLWGTWESLIFVLTTLRRGDLFDLGEERVAWELVGGIYENHPHLVTSRRLLDVAIGRLAVRAWDARKGSSAGEDVAEPGFIAELRSPRRRKAESSADPGSASISDENQLGGTMPSDGMVDDMGLSMDDAAFDFSLDMTDWAFWDELMQGQQS